MVNDLSSGQATGSAVEAENPEAEIPADQAVMTETEDSAAETDAAPIPDAAAGHAGNDGTSPAGEIQDEAAANAEAAGGTGLPDDGTVLLKRIDAALESFHSRAQHYEETNRLLHSRIESLQSDQVRVLLKPVFERLATLQAQAADAAADARDRDPSSAGDFDFFAISIDELLALYDVEPVGAAPGIVFDSRLHHGARIVPTADPELDGRIQRVQRQGYKYAGADRVMLPARVSVYRHTAPDPAPEAVPDSEQTIS